MPNKSRQEKTKSLTALQQRVVREIVALVRREGRQSGDHLTELELSKHIGTSRSPVQSALSYLAKEGVVQQDMNRGYYMLKNASDWGVIAKQQSALPDNPLYLQIATDRQSKNIPDEVSESELMRRYVVARGSLRKVLARISEEGWIEQKIGHGWCFLPLIDSSQAYEESYLFRQAIEPIGILSPSFRFDPTQLAELRREQQKIASSGYQTMTAIELFEANSRFHETLATWSNNRFIAQSVRRVNLQRRLVEYQQASKREPRKTQADEHVQILNAIANQDLVQAASLMRNHLDGARQAKSLAKIN